jgi:ABC-type transport system involved in cytochrome c biogenesis permease subunit
MNWKLIFQLSLFGLAMGVGTVFFISSTAEPFFWLAIFIVSAYLIATRVVDKHFLHGVALGVANSIWITGAHVLLFARYIANHPREAAMMSSMPMPTHPRVMMLIMGPVIGVVSGIVLGLLAMLAHRLVAPRARPAVSSS